MRKFFNAIKTAVHGVPDMSQETTFFKKVNAKTTQKPGIQPEIVTRIHSLDRIIVQGRKREQLLSLIERIAFQTRMGSTVNQDMRNACEIVHYSLVHETPVLVRHLRVLEPQLDISKYRIIDEVEYEKWLKQQNGHQRGKMPENAFIGDTYNQNDRREEFYTRKQDQSSWNFDQKDQGWTRRR